MSVGLPCIAAGAALLLAQCAGSGSAPSRAAGNVNYDQEWWHYTLRDEPYPDQYFDFPIQ